MITNNELLPFYKKYVSLHVHFATKNYDYKKYKSKTHANLESFLERNDRNMFASQYHYAKADPEKYLLANFIYNDSQYILDFTIDNLNEYNKRNESLTYHFQQQSELLAPVFNDNFKYTENSYPFLFNEYVAKRITIETLLILDQLCGYLAKWNAFYKDDDFYQYTMFRVNKYRLIFNPEISKFKKLILDKYT